MKRLYFMILVGLSILFYSCSDIFFEEDAEDTPENNFEIFWKDYDQIYSFFELKGLNWDSMYRVKRPLVNAKTTDKELFEILGEMVLYLKDGHADILSPFGSKYYDFRRGAPVNRLNSVIKYVKGRTINAGLYYGLIEDKIGYINITTFRGQIPISEFEKIDEILEDFNKNNVSSIIIDIRSNGGVIIQIQGQYRVDSTIKKGFLAM